MLLVLVALAAAVLALEPIALQRWLDQVQKPSNYFTLLAGSCGPNHDLFVDSQLERFPGRFRRVDISGPQQLFSQTIKALNQHCSGFGACPSLVVFIRQLDADHSGRELEELYRAFYGQAICQSAEFGGLKPVDCTKVWFVISTCVGQATSNEEAPASIINRLESHIPMSPEELNQQVRYELKSYFGFGKEFVSRLPLVVVPTTTSTTVVGGEEELQQLVDQLYNKLQQLQATTNNQSRGDGKIDPSLLDQSHFIGQEWARKAALNALDAVAKKIKQTKGPIVFFLLGSSGAGKTLLAKLIAQAYHGKPLHELQLEKKFVLFPMAEYKSECDVDSFTSPRQGIVGKGSLIDVFEATTSPVLVFDEIEKAHPSLLNEMMLAMLDDNHGFVQDKKDTSKRYSTSNAVFILTSNCYADTIAAKFTGHNEREVSRHVLFEMENADATKSRCAAFSKTEVARRMKAGHAFSNLQEFGFVVFVPPPVTVVETMVTFFLREYALGYKQGRFVWTDRAERLLKRLAKQQYLSTSKSKHGGLSEVQSHLTGVLTEVMRVAMHDCPSNGGQRDVLLHERDQDLVARVVRCGASIPSITKAVPLSTAINNNNDNVKEKQHVEVETKEHLEVEKEEEKHIEVEKEEEKHTEVEKEEEKHWEWQWLVAYLFAFALAVMLVLSPVAAVQLAVSLASMTASMVSLASVALPHAGTGLLMAALWPWLGWKSLVVVPVANLVFNLFFPMGSVVSWMFARFKRSPSSSLLYVSVMGQPQEQEWFRSELLVELRKRIQFRNDAFTATPKQVKQQIQTSCGLLLCVGKSQLLLDNLNEWNALELLLGRTLPVLVAVPSSLAVQLPTLNDLDSKLSQSAWERIRLETGLANPPNELLRICGQWTSRNYLVYDADIRLARLQLMLWRV
ncbi:hypothetical protein BASA81_001533 [Batrachochytrium salamandrivorans]|nr:hypothetical protein BASA81_001533 [Batrachochytrium salamandrivorans]